MHDLERLGLDYEAESCTASQTPSHKSHSRELRKPSRLSLEQTPLPTQAHPRTPVQRVQLPGLKAVCSTTRSGRGREYQSRIQVPGGPVGPTSLQSHLEPDSSARNEIPRDPRQSSSPASRVTLHSIQGCKSHRRHQRSTDFRP